MFNKFKKLTISNQLISIIVVIIIVMWMFIGITYYYFKNVIYEKNNEYTEEMILKIQQNISSNVDVLNKIITNVAYNGTIQKYLIEDNKVKEFEIYQDMTKYISNMSLMKDGIMNIMVIGNNGKRINVPVEKDSSQKIECFLKEIPDRNKAYYSGLNIMDFDVKNKKYIMVGTNIYSIQSGKKYGKSIGHLIMLLDIKTISPEIDSMSQKIAGNFYILDKNDIILYSNERDKITNQMNISNITDNKKYITHIKNLPDINGKIISTYEKNELFSGLSRIKKIYIAMCIFFILFILSLFLIITHNILQPINSFINFVSNINSGNLKILKNRINLEGYSEITIMANAFNKLLDEIDKLTHRLVITTSKLYELELSKKQAELEFLKSQINPHFLYNTLESIRGMGAMHGIKEIIIMTTALSNILRYSIKGEEQVYLKKELSIIKSYLQIQQLRFENRFDVVYNIDKNILDKKVLKMILQPFVENAIIHGVEKDLNKTTLIIGAKLNKKNELILWVYDNGTGIDSNILSKLQNKLIDYDDNINKILFNRQHIGILNVNNRIKLTYGKQYGVIIKSKKSNGTKVIVKIPILGEG